LIEIDGRGRITVVNARTSMPAANEAAPHRALWGVAIYAKVVGSGQTIYPENTYMDGDEECLKDCSSYPIDSKD
jgi:hypothetical protein